jgi:hypothetical protein
MTNSSPKWMQRHVAGGVMRQGGGLLSAGSRGVTKGGRHPLLKGLPQENPLILGGGGGPTTSRPRTGRENGVMLSPVTMTKWMQRHVAGGVMRQGGGLLSVGSRGVTKGGRHPLLKAVPQENPLIFRGWWRTHHFTPTDRTGKRRDAEPR